MSVWSEERLKTLKTMWSRGASASDIVAEIGAGLTKNAVIGKAHRLGLQRGADTNKMTQSAAGKLGVVAQRVAAKRAQAGTVAPTPKPLVPVKKPVDLPAPTPQTSPLPAPTRPRDSLACDSQPVTIIDLRDNMCHWPLGDPATSSFRYCGALIPVECGPYCGHHRAIAYAPRLPRRPKAA